ncbi:HD domain-containing protein [Ginsengibacter hankyongi]|uniref:HD domain-containing protein n=1 Tax=Ginsengibacter hankyongi TaxID=2607284 RepID=UPI00192818FF|nr:HD domain-containing protein [Ginsengibacter hankyongi]
MNTYSPEEKFILQCLEKELPGNLSYHGLHHTLDVFNAAMKIAATENLSAEEIKLLRIAILYHDAGFTAKYKDHEEKGCEMARKNLPSFGYTDGDIKIICGMIMATQIPQTPKTILEKIICDADLDYLGRNDFYEISNTLFEEMKIYNNLHDEKEWNKIQKKFLDKHQYHTEFGKKHREHKKQQYLQEINQLVSSGN